MKRLLLSGVAALLAGVANAGAGQPVVVLPPITQPGGVAPQPAPSALPAVPLQPARPAAPPAPCANQGYGPSQGFGAGRCATPQCEVPKPGCDGCDDGTCFWVRGEYLLWWVRGASLPPLLSVSPPGTALGAIPTTGTTVFGGGRANDDVRQGFRVRVGGYLDEDRRCAIEARFFYLEGLADGGSIGLPPTTAGGTGTLVASRPFINALTGAPAAELVAFPGVITGQATVDASSSNFFGGDAVLRHNLCCSACCPNPCACKDDSPPSGYRVDLLAGYRFLYYTDSVSITERLAPIGGAFLPGTEILVRDDFQARNRFHGGVVGLHIECCKGPWLFEVSPRVSVGQISRDVNINGFTVVSAPGAAPVARTGGLLAQTSNIGSRGFNDVGVLPEIDVAVGYRVSRNLRLYAGYTFIYWPDVARAGEQIDPVVNPNLVPGPAGPAPGPLVGPARPAYLGSTSDLWLQGITLGAEVRF